MVTGVSTIASVFQRLDWTSVIVTDDHILVATATSSHRKTTACRAPTDDPARLDPLVSLRFSSSPVVASQAPVQLTISADHPGLDAPRWTYPGACWWACNGVRVHSRPRSKTTCFPIEYMPLLFAADLMVRFGKMGTIHQSLRRCSPCPLSESLYIYATCTPFIWWLQLPKIVTRHCASIISQVKPERLHPCLRLCPSDNLNLTPTSAHREASTDLTCNVTSNSPARTLRAK